MARLPFSTAAGIVGWRSNKSSAWLSRRCSSSTASLVEGLHAVMQYAQSIRTGGASRVALFYPRCAQ